MLKQTLKNKIIQLKNLKSKDLTDKSRRKYLPHKTNLNIHKHLHYN